MKIIFDLTKTQPIGNIKFHGGGRYGEMVFKSLITKSNNIIVYYNSDIWLNPEIKNICINNMLLMIDSNEMSLNQLAKDYKGIVYSPLIEDNLNIIGPEIIYITTIHGLRTLEMTNDIYTSSYKKYYLRWIYKVYYTLKSKITYSKSLKWYRDVFERSNIHIITVSEHSKSSILSFIPHLKSEQITVCYSPSTIVHSDSSIVPYSNEKYYLIISADRWIKNALRAIIAFDEIFTERPEFKGNVILTGLKDKSIFKGYIKNLERFSFIDYVDENILLSLYKGAYLFVYPTLNEGFGYPPIEAMTLGTPVIASAVSSIPEICGDSVLYFNPFLISEIKMRILQMENVDLRSEYIERQYLRVNLIKNKQDNDLNILTNFILSFLD